MSNAAKLRSSGDVTAGDAERLRRVAGCVGCRLLLEDRRRDRVRQGRLALIVHTKRMWCAPDYGDNDWMSARCHIAVREFDSKATLLEFLAAAEIPNIILGRDIPGPAREFFCFQILRDGSAQLNVGVLSFGIGVKPSWVFQHNALLIGFNDQVAVFDTNHVPRMILIPVPSLFWEFLEVQDVEHRCVLCETGLIAIASTGTVLWCVDTPLICNYELKGATLWLEFDDHSSQSIDLSSGHRV